MVNIALFMIVKNESSIITRCLDSLKKYIDFVIISDTGSTDNTVEIINNYLLENNIRGKVYNDEWKNFGHNRTKSILNAQQWLEEEKIEKSDTYLLTIDADMIVKFKDDFNKENLKTHNMWCICQYNSSIKYYNSRIFRADYPYKCTGVTHEYWECDTLKLGINMKNNEGKFESIYIDDRGDGGCKSDKFTRDIQLLTKGLEDEPGNYRYYFYLAQSYGDIGDVDNSIKWYNERVNAGGWFEEIFISYKRIGELYMSKGDIEKAIYNWLLAYETIPYRSETLYKICNYYRNKGLNNLSLLYLKKGLSIPFPKDLVLFLEYPIYEYNFLKELAIIGFYVNKKKEGRFACQELLLNNDIPGDVRDEAFSNNYFYLESLSSYPAFKKHTILSIETRYPFAPSNPCFLFNHTNKTFKGIVRAVNYSINDSFEYNIRDDNNYVTTINYWTEFDKDLNLKMMYEIECNTKKLRESHIKGLEDLRICAFNNKIYGLAVDWEHGSNNHPSVILVHFDKDDDHKYVINNVIPITYNDHICQKNWTLFSEDSKLFALYSHHPLTILEINPNNGEYTVIKEKYSKYNLQDIRGSANPIRIVNDNCWLVLVHEVVHKDTRKYYHRFLKYSNDWELLNISEPFYFKNLFVEFSVSIMHDNKSNNLMIVYSTRDNTCEIMTVDYSLVPWLPENIKEHLISTL